MSRHPSHKELESFLLGHEGHERASILSHLARCQACRLEAAAKIQAIAKIPKIKSGEDAYDAAIDNVLARLPKMKRDIKREQARARQFVDLIESGGLDEIYKLPLRSDDVSLVEALLDRSWSLRHDNPARMVQLATFALGVTTRLRSDVLGEEQLADIKCRVWAELSNAYRVVEDLKEAERAMGSAAEFFLAGTRDDFLKARICDLQGSLYSDLRRFELAMAAVDMAYRIHRRYKDYQAAGRVLISKGAYAGAAGNSQDAVRLTRRGLDLIQKEHDPALFYQGVHNLAYWLMQSGDLRKARTVLWPNLGRPEESGGRLNLLKLRWLEGEINAGLGELNRAEQAFLTVHEAFEKEGLPYTASVLSLHLAAVWFRQGRIPEMRKLVLKAIEVFTSLKIQREALGALVLLQNAVEMKVETLELLESVTQFMKKSQHDSQARFEPPLR